MRVGPVADAGCVYCPCATPMSDEPASTPRSTLLANLVAGTTTAVVIIPQAMAYAMVAGVPPIHGLYASVLPLVAYALVGRSRELAVGPGALDTLLVGFALGSMAFVISENWPAYAAVLALLVGGIQLTLGLLRAGFFMNFVSAPVINGFTSAAAITIALSQLDNLLGYTCERGAGVFEMLRTAIVSVPDIHAVTAVTGVASALALVALKKWRRSFPRALAVVAVATVVSMAFDFESRGVAVIGAVPAGLPGLSMPTFDAATWRQLVPTAITIAFVGYLTMISIARTFANRTGRDIDANRELVAAGAANLAAAFSRGFPVSASFSRSAVHASAGSTTPKALLVVAGWVTLTLLLLTDLLYALPTTTLAAIIITAVSGLFDAQEPRRLWRVKRADAVLLGITFVATLAFGIEDGILTGVAASVLLVLTRTTRPHTAVLGRVGDTTDYRNVRNYPDAAPTLGLLVVRIDAQFYFGNVTFLKDVLRRLERDADAPVHTVIIDAASLNQLDSSADAALHQILDDYDQRGLRLAFATVKMPVLNVMRASGLYERLGHDRFFMNVHAAVEALREPATPAASPPASGDR